MELRRLVRDGCAPASLLYHLNEFVIESFGSSGMYATLFCCEWDAQTDLLRHAGSGHPPALLWRADAQCFERLESANPMIGIERVQRDHFQQAETCFGAGDHLVLYTDGVLESVAENAIDGLIARIQPVVRNGAAAIADATVLRPVTHTPSPPPDDMYVVVLSVKT